MNVALTIIAIIAYSIFLNNRRWGVVLVLTLCFCAPPFRFGDFSFSFHYAFSPLVLSDLIKCFSIKNLSKTNAVLGLVLLAYILFSFLWIGELKIAPLIGTIYVFILLLFFERNISDRLMFSNSLILLIVINASFVLIQSAFPKIGYQILNDWYFTNSRSVAIGDSLEWYGMLRRKTGAFFSPLLLAQFCFLSWYYFMKIERFMLSWLVFGLGFLTVSKAYLVAVTIVLIMILFRNMLKSKLWFFLSVVFLVGAFYFFTDIVSLTMGFSSVGELVEAGISSRYEGDNLNLLYFYTMEAIQESPIIGHGFTFLEGVFIGDSFWVDELYRGGAILLLALVMTFYIRLDDIYLFIPVMILGTGLGLFMTLNMILIFLVADFTKYKVKPIGQ